MTSCRRHSSGVQLRFEEDSCQQDRERRTWVTEEFHTKFGGGKLTIKGILGR